MTDVPEEIARQSHGTAHVLALLRARKGMWIAWGEFSKIAPCAWRTRISNARQLAKADGEVVEWNRNPRQSAYRLIDQPLGREASNVSPADRLLFDIHPRT